MQLRRQRLYSLVPLVAGVVQHDRDRPDQSLSGDVAEQFAHRFRVDHRGVGHREKLPGDSVPRSQNVETLATGCGPDEDAGERPQAAEEGAEDEVGGVDEEDVSGACLSGVERRLELGLQEVALDFNVLGQ